MNDKKNYTNTAILALQAYELKNFQLTRLGGADNINRILEKIASTL